MLSDTTFVLTVSGDGPVSGPATGAAYPPGYKKADGSGTDSVACVNKRSAPGDRSLSCEEGTGEVIEDPLSGEPALLMYPRRDPPQWLTSVPTEICIEDGGKVPRIAVPTTRNVTAFALVPLVERKGQRLCTPADWRLSYVLVRQHGIEIDGVKHHRLGSRGMTASGWKLLAETPSEGGLTQRILLVPPAPPSVASAPKPAPLQPPAPVPVPGASPPTFAVILSEWRWNLSIRKLWYAPLPAGGDSGRSFKCENGALSLGTEVWGKDKLIEADAVSVKTVLKLPPALRVEVTQPPAKLASLRKGLVLLAEGSGGSTYCGIARPLPGSTELEAKLQPEEKAAPPRDVELKPAPLALPAELWLKPVVHLGKRPLALASCKVTLAGLPADEFRHERDGRTHVKVSPDRRGRIGAVYRVEVGGSAKVCAGFEGEAMQAQKLAALAKGTELTVPVRHPGGRAFVGILSWPLGEPDDEGNWRAALKALAEAFDAGAHEGRYLWGAIYAPDGKRLVASETADYMPLEVDAYSPETIGRFKAGGAALRYEEAVKRVVADVADLEGNVDLLVVAVGAEGACKWSNPFTSAATRGGRSALVRVVKAAPGQSTDAASRARMCDVVGDQSSVGLAVEVAVDPATVGGASDRLLREALEAAAKNLLGPAPEVAPKAKAEPPPSDRKIASVAPAPVETAVAETYHDRYELPYDYRPLAVAYLAAPYAGSFTGPASTFRIGPVAPGTSLFVRFLKRTGGAQPWEGIPLGLFRGESGKPGTRLSVAESTLGLGGSKALHPTLYAFVPEEPPVAGFRVLTFESDAGRKASEVFSLLADTSFLLKAYLDGSQLGMVETVACVNKRSSPPSCEDSASQAVEDPLSGGPALLMVGHRGPPKWLTAVPTEICVDSSLQGPTKAPPKVGVPSGSGKHREISLVRQAGRWCTSVTKLDYVTVREDGIRIAGEPPRKRLDSRLQKSVGAWSLRAAAPRKGADGDWVQQLVLAPAGAVPR